jgi:solute carrier family 25 oxoglutarate transporter 11
MKAGLDGRLPYAGVADCFRKTVAREGFFGLWAGFPVYYARVAPYTMIVKFNLNGRCCSFKTNFT